MFNYFFISLFSTPQFAKLSVAKFACKCSSIRPVQFYFGWNPMIKTTYKSFNSQCFWNKEIWLIEHRGSINHDSFRNLDSMYGMVVLKMGFKFWNHIRVFCQLLWISESRRRGSNIQTINYLFGNYFKAPFWGSKNGTKIERCCSLANWRVNKI